MIRLGVPSVFRLALRRRDRWERDVEEEIKLHLALRAEQLVSRGATPDDACQEAVRRFGPLDESRARLIEAARHREHRMQRSELLTDLRLDIGFALRTLARQKSWAAVTIGTMALGIGATTAVFSVVDTLLLHPLPYPQANRIVYVDQQPSAGNNTGVSVRITPAAREMRAWIANAHSFEALEGIDLRPRSLQTIDGESRPVNTAMVLPTFPSFAGARPMVGRMFSRDDILRGEHLVVLGESFWRNRLGASGSVLGQRLTLNDTAYTIVGVMPATLALGASSTTPVALWLPLDLRNDDVRMSVLGRLRPGVTTARAAVELDSIAARVRGFSAGTTPFRTVITTPSQRVSFHDSLMMLAGAVALVLLVACANVAHLLLARSATRRRELAIRAALGAGRRRLLRQLLTESLLLTVAASGLGVFVGWFALRAIVSVRPGSLDVLANAHLDLTTVAFAAAVAIVCGIVFSLTGAVHGARHAPYDALKQGAAGVGTSRRRSYGRNLLVVSEMTLSATLLVGATLLIRTVVQLQHADLGFEPAGLYALSVPLDTRPFAAPETRAETMRALMTRLDALPGVQSAAVASVEPGSRRFYVGRLEIEGEPLPPQGVSAFIDVNAVQPGYFHTMGIRVVDGSTFTDTTTTSGQVIVNAGFARAHWPRGGAIGRRLRIADTDVNADPKPWLTVIGVASDAQTWGPGLESTAPMFYLPMTTVDEAPSILVRVSGGASALAPAAAIQQALGIAHPAPPSSVADRMSRTIAAPRFVMTLMSLFTGVALVLSAIGLYGTMAYSVAQRTREIGIRVALGASGQRIARSVVGQGLLLAGMGVVAGLAVASWATRLIQTQLYGVTRLDPASFAVGAVALIGAALVACVVPTRRALAVDPVTAIRAE